MSKKIHFLLFFFLCLASIPLVAQNIEVKGVVTEATTNEPLPGVTVKVKGKDTGTVTNMDGKYTIKANKSDILVFSTIGMKSIERTILSDAPINVSMEEDNVTLEQVVVIGYGTAKKSHLSGAVSSVGAKELNGAVATNAGTALQGKIAGVSVTSTSGDPNEGMTINVRGVSSLSNNDPLYVIDGAFGDLSMVDPSDIASIEVLKDAAAAAIYGSRAAGGVVLVTTKSGRKDMPTKLNVNFFTGFSQTPKTLKVFNGEEYSRFARYYNLAADGYGLMIRMFDIALGNFEFHRSGERIFLTPDRTEEIRNQLWEYLDEHVYSHWDLELLDFLMKLTIVEEFDLELAKKITGNQNAERMIAKALDHGTGIQRRVKEYSREQELMKVDYEIRPPVRRSLFWKLQKTYGEEEIQKLYRRAGEYYEQNDRIPMAFQLYENAGDQERLKEFLIDHSRRNPAAGNYFELKQYYFQLQEETMPCRCFSPMVVSTS